MTPRPLSSPFLTPYAALTPSQPPNEGVVSPHRRRPAIRKPQEEADSDGRTTGERPAQKRREVRVFCSPLPQSSGMLGYLMPVGWKFGGETVAG